MNTNTPNARPFDAPTAFTPTDSYGTGFGTVASTLSGTEAQRVNTPEELLAHQLAGLYDAEQRLAAALPLMADCVQNPDVREAILQHAQETAQQVQRLDQCFTFLNVPRPTVSCDAVAGMVQEFQQFQSLASPECLEGYVIAGGCKIEAYESAAYLGVKALATVLDLRSVVDLLDESLDEEERTAATMNGAWRTWTHAATGTAPTFGERITSGVAGVFSGAR